MFVLFNNLEHSSHIYLIYLERQKGYHPGELNCPPGCDVLFLLCRIYYLYFYLSCLHPISLGYLSSSCCYCSSLLGCLPTYLMVDYRYLSYLSIVVYILLRRSNRYYTRYSRITTLSFIYLIILWYYTCNTDVDYVYILPGEAGGGFFYIK